MKTYLNINSGEYEQSSSPTLMIAGYAASIASACMFWQLCGLRDVSSSDSILKVIFDVSVLGSFASIGLYVGYYHSEKLFNPDKQLIEPQTSEWQALFLRLGSQQSREELARILLAASQKRSHRFWFEVLLSTTENIAVNDDKARYDTVRSDLTRKGVKVTSQEALKRISGTLRYQELERWFPKYILEAAEGGNTLAKDFQRYLPMKTRFFQKKTAIRINK